MFSRDEIVALVAGARLNRAWGGADMARAAEEALIKIDAVLPGQGAHPKQSGRNPCLRAEMTPEVRERIDRLEEAARPAQAPDAGVSRCERGEDGPNGPAAGAVVLGQGMDAGRLVRAARGFPHVPPRPDRWHDRDRRHIPGRTGHNAQGFLPEDGRVRLPQVLSDLVGLKLRVVAGADFPQKLAFHGFSIIVEPTGHLDEGAGTANDTVAVIGDWIRFRTLDANALTTIPSKGKA